MFLGSQRALSPINIGRPDFHLVVIDKKVARCGCLAGQHQHIVAGVFERRTEMAAHVTVRIAAGGR